MNDANGLDRIVTFVQENDWIAQVFLIVFIEIKQGVLLKIMAIISQHGAEIAFPTSTLHVESMPEVEV